LILLSGLAPPAAAQDRPIKLLLDTTAVWDANVFRVPESNTDPQFVTRGLTGRSDRFATTKFGLKFDKSYAQQRVTFEAGQSATRYDKFAFLDRNALNYQGAWQWHFTPRISGTLSADRSETLIGFDDTTALVRNVRVSRNKGFSVDGWLFGGWHLIAGLSESETKSTSAFAAQPDFTQTSGDLGLKYLAASGSFLSFTQRARKGSYTGRVVDLVNFLDSGFTARETELAAEWKVSGKSSLNGRLTSISRHHSHVPERDVSGYAGDLRYAWTPMGKLAVNVSATRTLIPFTPDTRTSYRVDDTLSVSPVWTVGPHTTLSVNAFRRTTDYLGPVVPVTGPLRRDALRSIQVAASWTPHPKVTLRASVQRDRRQSNDATFNYDDAITNLTASLAF
jgi:exopolysaccharide biosynthesis operon protein EpsL